MKNASKRFYRKNINGKKFRINKKRVNTEVNSLGWLKLLIVIIIIASQVGMLIYLALSFAFTFKWVMAVDFLLSLCLCFYVLSSNKNNLSKGVWIIFLLLGFPFAPLIFLLSTEKVAFFRLNRKTKDCLFLKNEQNVDLQSLQSQTKSVANFLYTSGNFNAYKNNAVKYFSLGDQFFNDVLNSIEKAQKFIFMEFFIVSDGTLFERVFEVLKEKAKSGVDVRIIYDDMGSSRRLYKKTIKKIKDSNIKIMTFNRITPIFSIGQNYRDHRKIVVVDGQTAYTGGYNLADEYVNLTAEKFFWKDMGVRIDGNAVDEFTRLFLIQWSKITRQEVDLTSFTGLATINSNHSAVIPFADGLEYKETIGKGVYINLISNAREYLYISCPYFIIDDTIKDLLINKARSGVQVKIILPEIPDKTLVYWVSRNNAEKLIKHGVKIYTMKNAFVHGKVMLNENGVVIGSINLDLRSFYQQAECAVYTDDKSVIKEVKSDFEFMEKRSLIIDEQNKLINNSFKGVIVKVLQIFAPFM